MATRTPACRQCNSLVTVAHARLPGRHGVSSRESRDPIGFAVAAMNRLAQSDLLDRLGIRKQTEKAVFAVTRTGFRTATTAGRAFARAGQARQRRRPSRARRAVAASST